jgi:uncharacterized repeat protein (TIGR01451 family)
MERIMIIAGLLSAQQVIAQPLSCDFSTSAEICYQANGTVVASVSGGTPPYAYLWTPEPPTGQGTPSLMGLPSGAYSLTVTDALGTEGIFVVDVVHDLSLGWTGAGSYVGAHALSGFGVPCEGECNGAMAMPNPPVVEGPFLYEWSDPTITQIATSPQGDPVFFGFCADGTYSYTVSNPMGCSSTSQPFTNPMVPDASLWTLGDTIVPSECDGFTGYTELLQDLAWPWLSEVVVTNEFGTTYQWNSGTNWLFLGDFSPGPYIARVTFDSSACTQNILFTVPGVGEGCDGVGGVVHLDGDLDCMQDPGEPSMPGRLLRVDPGGMLAITDAQGNYSMALDDGEYTLTWLDTTSEPNCPAATAIPFSVNGASAVVDIAATGDGPLDLSITAANSFARPGFVHRIWAQVSNLGFAPSNDATLTCVLSPELSYVLADPLPTSVVGNTITWDIAALDALGSTVIGISTSVDVQAILGNYVQAQFSVVNNGPEDNTENNTYAARHLLTGSYDPNDKTAFTSTGQSATDYVLTQDAFIDYVIRFQNTGTDTAFTVVITDTLAAELDMTTFVQGAASHPFTVAFKPDRVVEWRFSNIQLPDSNVNEAASHGAVGFRIRPMLPLQPGTELANAADIFFDFNAPIRTNTSTLMATMATGVAEHTEPELLLFPNPTNGHFTIALEGQELTLLRLFSTDGRLAVQQRLTGTRAEVALEGLAPGAYRAEVRTTEGAVYQRSVLVQ